MTAQGIQKELFERKETEEDRMKNFLKRLFTVIEQTYSFKLVDEAYTEYRILKEIEEEMERDAIGEEGDDF